MNELDPFLYHWIETFLWQSIKSDVEKTGGVTPFVLLKVSPLLNLPSKWQVRVDTSKYFEVCIADFQQFRFAIVELDLKDKATSAFVVRSLIDKWQSDMAIWVAEAWIVDSPVSEDESLETACTPPPRLDPRRQEIVLISIQTPSGTWASNTQIKWSRSNRIKLPSTPKPFSYVGKAYGTLTVDFSSNN